MRRFACVVGTRPNFVKIAPILRALRRYRNIEPILIHTGQHYDTNLSDVFFADLELPDPDHHLGVGSGSHGNQTGRVIERFEELIDAETHAGRPFDLVLVVGDVNSTLACALVAAKANIPLAHVEAGRPRLGSRTANGPPQGHGLTRNPLRRGTNRRGRL